MIPGGDTRRPSRWAIRYTPGTDLARRFGTTPSKLRFHTPDGAEQMRSACANAEHMDIVEVTA